MTYNKWGSDTSWDKTAGQPERYRGGWSSSNWGSSNWDAAKSGTKEEGKKGNSASDWAKSDSGQKRDGGTSNWSSSAPVVSVEEKQEEKRSNWANSGNNEFKKDNGSSRGGWSNSDWSKKSWSGPSQQWGNSNWSNDKWQNDKWSNEKWSKSSSKDWSKKDGWKRDDSQRSYGGGKNGWSGGGWSASSKQPIKLWAVDFSTVQLVDFVKEFYVPTESVKRRSEDECEKIRRANRISIISGDQVPKPIISFEESSFPDYIVRSLYRQFGPDARPTPIQMQGWPIAMSGRSMVGIAQTGSGKTLAYILPAVVHINAQAPAAPREGPIALVLVPTRELCAQIAQEAEKFSEAVKDVGGIPSRIACAFGGVNKAEQSWALKDSLDILVASPGRLMDFLGGGDISLHRTTYLVLDEADQMFDMGFEPQLRQILGQIRPDRQTLMWSATWPREVRNLAQSVCVDAPVHVQIGSDSLAANHQIHQVVSLVSGEKEKLEKLFSEVLPQLYLTESGERVDDAKMLIFCNTKDSVDFLTEKMRKEGVAAVAIHSGKDQKERLWVFDQFRAGDTKVLVSTNLMGRGVDVPKVNIVLNYDLPKTISEYIHRIGRTARAGAVGKAVSFVSYSDGPLVRDLVGVMNEAEQTVPDWLEELNRNPYFRA